MRRTRRLALAGVVLAAAVAAALVGGVASRGTATAGAAAPCTLANGIKHVVYLQFDNTHYRRDNSSVPSDLEQMPHLLNFLKGQGTLLTNDHTVLISHTADGILSSLTGLYPDRNGMTVGNSYDYFQSSGIPRYTSSFKYWTDTVDGTSETLPNMVGEYGQTTEAPWLTYTQAGCNVGGVSAANIELENSSTKSYGDMTRVFGTGSPEWNEAVANPSQAQTDFVGYAIHCAQGAALCDSPNAKPDDLTTVPGSNDGYEALFGAKYVNPAIGGTDGCVKATDGTNITDSSGNCGFPGFDGAVAKNTLGEVEQMQENGVPVTFAYISDAHDNHTSPYGAYGPGEAAYKQQLAAYDAAFASFFSNLAAHGIDKSNTLFVVTVDEGDHFAGGTGTPDGSGNLTYTHANCTDLSACPSNQIGEIDANLPALLPSGEPTYDIHFDDAPTFYVNGAPERTNPSVRKLEQDVATTSLPDPYAAGGSAPISVKLADTVEEKTLHMIDGDPKRTPTFTMFGNPDFYFQIGKACGSYNECVSPSYAWNHGDVQDEIGNTWAGYVGPGVQNLGVDSTTWTDHTDLRATINALLGLQDDYADDGRVVTQIVSKTATPASLRDPNATKLGDAYKAIDAPFGAFAMDTLTASTAAVSSTDASKYDSIESRIGSLTAKRDALAGQIRQALNDAADGVAPIDGGSAQSWIAQANGLLAQAHALATSS